MNAPIHPIATGICYFSGTALTLFGIGGWLSPPKLFEFFGMPPSTERNQLEPAFSNRNLVMGLTILNFTRFGSLHRYALGVTMTGLTAYAIGDAITVSKTKGAKNLQNHLVGTVVYGGVAAYLLGYF